MTEGTGHGPEQVRPDGELPVSPGHEQVEGNAVEQERSAQPPEPADKPPGGPGGPADRPPGGPGDDRSDVPPEFKYLVRGQVIYRGGLPVESLLVRAFNKELRTEDVLGEATTDADGKFEIYYSTNQFRDGAKRNPDLLVRAYGGDGKEVLGQSRVFFSAPRIQKVRLLLEGGPETIWSEYEQLTAEIEPLLEGTPITELTEDGKRNDITLLAGKTGQQPSRIAALVVAHKLARRTGIAPEVFYGLARQDQPTKLGDLLAQSRDVQRKALEQAIADRVVPARLGDALDAVRKQLDAQRVAVAHPSTEAPIGRVLASVLDDPDHAADFLNRYVEHRGRIDAFWKALGDDERYVDRVPELQTTIQLAALTGNHVPLVQRLQKLRRNGEFTSFRQLARFGQADWERVVMSSEVPEDQLFPPSVPGDTVQEKAAIYAETITRILEDTVPTEVVAFRAQADESQPDDVRTFWRNVTSAEQASFQLGRGDVRSYLGANEFLLDGVADREALFASLESVQRMYNITTSYPLMQSLAAEQLDSAFAITELGQPVFVTRMADLGVEAAKATIMYEKAGIVAANALQLFATYSPVFNNLPLWAVPEPDARQIPNLETLFGSMDLCGCADCRSVYSPAAYLAELLAFLKERRQTVTLPFGVTMQTNARELLFRRRPDIGEIELTCDNTNVPLPYVDLVNEVLEERIAPFPAFDLPASVSAELDARTVSATLRAAFDGAGYPLTEDHFAVVVHPTTRWFVTDHNDLYSIARSSGGAIRVISHGYQTGAPAAVVGANPQHVAAAAYDQLRAALYPWTLPLDLWWEEARAYLGHLHADRADLMAEFAPGDPAVALTSIAMATERLGCTVIESELITGSAPVRAATTAGLAPLEGTNPVDGVAVVAGDQVLVKNQTDPQTNGIYRVDAGPWSRVVDATHAIVVREGATNAGTHWLVDPNADPIVTQIRPWSTYGLNQSGNPVTVYDSTASTGQSEQALGWLEALAHVRELLARTGLSYDELVDVLATSYVNPDGDIDITSDDPQDLTTCDVLKLILTNFDQAATGRLHRFVRLWRRLGWTVAEVDHAIRALRSGVADVNQRIDPQLLLTLAHLQQLRDTLNLPVDQLLVLWSPIGTAGEDPLYARLFLDPAVITPPDPAFVLDGAELAIVTADPAEARISKHVPTILAAGGLAAADLTALTTTVVTDDALTLANLSMLIRQAILARANAMSVADSLALQQIAGIDPFDATHTENALLFGRLATRVRGTGLTVADLDYLLFNRAPDATPLAPAEDAVAAILDDLRRGLHKIEDDTTPQPDPQGDQTARALVALRWPAALVEEVRGTLAGTASYTASLAALPGGLVFPPSVGDRVTYDGTANLLQIRGPLTVGQRNDLLAASNDVPYQTAVTALFNAPRTVVTVRMRAYEWPRVSAPLASLPGGITFPAPLRNKIYYDLTTKMLWFDGFMTGAEAAEFINLSADLPYRTAVQALRDASATVPLVAANAFLGAADAAALFDANSTAADRFALVLGKLLAYQRVTAGTRLVIRKLSEALRLDSKLVERLLNQLSALTDNTQQAIADFLAPAYAGSNANVVLISATFPSQFGTYTRLAKIATLVKRLRLSARQLGWLGSYAAGVPVRPVPWVHGVPLTVRWLGLEDLPAQEIPRTPARFAAWLRLLDLCALRDGLPGGETTLGDVLALARDATVPPATLAGQILTLLADRTGWDRTGLSALVTLLGLAPVDSFKDESGLLRLRTCVRRLRRLGASTAQVAEWVRPQPTSTDARAIRQAVKATYDSDEWDAVAKPLRDVLREKQRAALVAYLVAHASGSGRRDSDTLFQQLLIDVEMDPCMMTSRIKQAIGSVQLFVQRCLLNLEEDVTADATADPGWARWKWMKNYRVWEANRKVFLYPENWLLPELRDDKTPFFTELETELLQGDVTNEAVEDALVAYLEKLDQVARLEVAGMFHQEAAGGQPDILHVFGRTHGSPPVYFYRRWIGRSQWTPWERVDLDIAEQQILPIVWNRRLFLFWPVFTEAAEQQVPAGNEPAEPKRYFEIQLAWSELKRGKWRAKKLTPDTQKLRSVVVPDLTLSDHGRSKHVLRALITGEGELLVWYERDDPSTTEPTTPYGGGGGSTSSEWVSGFNFTGCNGRIKSFNMLATGIYQTTGTVVDGMFFVEAGYGPLNLPKGISEIGEAAALQKTPGQFSLLYPHQDGYLTGRRPFFFQDERRTYFVVPETHSVIEWIWTQPAWTDPVYIDLVQHYYYEPDPIPDPLGPVERFWDPAPIERVALEKQITVLAAETFVETPVPTEVPALALSRSTTTQLVPSRASTMSTPLTRTVATRKQLAIDMYHDQSSLIVSKGDHSVESIGRYIDDGRIFDTGTVGVTILKQVRRYRFNTFFHPYVCPLVEELNRVGIEGLLSRGMQLMRNTPFKGRYQPTMLVEKGNPATEDKYPVDDIDFSYEGAYSQYNWELFFHIPLLIAMKLSQNQRFESAQDWFHYIFDPTATEDPEIPRRYWRTRPFYEQQDYLAQRIDRIMEKLARGEADGDLNRQVSQWADNPFQPFAVARLRTVAFQKMVVMRYIDNLIAWGDQLFRRDTIESINEATQLYLLAAEILGPRPASIPPRAEPQVQTYNSLDPAYANFANKLVDIEYLFSSPRPDAVVSSPDAPPLPIPKMLYFCVPRNDVLLGYWDTVADRLFKIRHCMNIEGVVRQLPLFEPPIDPALLVKAAAAGIDISSALSDVGGPMPNYRFGTLVQQAETLISHVQSLGQALLGALEKRDVEELALIRAGQEITLLDLVEQTRKQQVSGATEQIDVLRKARQNAVARYTHYQSLLGMASPAVPAEGQPAVEPSSARVSIQNEEGIKLVQQERNELTSLKDAHDSQAAAADWDFAASIANVLPTLSFGVAWGALATVSWGGPNVGAALQAVANRWRTDADQSAHDGTRSGRLGQFVLRENDWVLQAKLAARDLAHVDQQIVGAQVFEQVAQAELTSHRMQMQQGRDTEEYLSSKYTNHELYDWMVGQSSALYFQAYQLAYDVAKRAERAFRYELGLADSNYVQFGYWDSLRKGLLAGERLRQDLHRMQAAYLDQHKREYEIVKHVSLASLHPAALVTLRETGLCFVQLPEAIFDLDHPGHYMRRIKSVGMSVPCTTGPYAGINCTLTLLGNQVRVGTQPAPYGSTGPGDKRFVSNLGGIQSIVTSSGRDDAGMFETNLRDERYLPFEGAGAISSWRVELPGEFRQFDYRTITDVVLHIHYTARAGGEPLRDAAVGNLMTALQAMELEPRRTGLFRAFSARHEFPDAWQRFLFKPPLEAGPQQLSLLLDADRFPTYVRDRAVKIDKIAVFALLEPGIAYDSSDPLALLVRPPTGVAKPVSLEVAEGELGGVPAQQATLDAGGPALSATVPWRLELTALPAILTKDIEVDGNTVQRLDPDLVTDVGILVHYTL
jgi:hypothetical protein